MKSAYSYDAIKRCVRASDSRDFDIDLKLDRETLVQAAIAAASLDPSPMSAPTIVKIQGRECFYYPDYAASLLVRATTKYVSRRFRIAVPNRDRVVKSVIEAMADASPFHVIRRDITGFYENLPTAGIRSKLLFDTAIPRQVRRHLRYYFNLAADPERGLPRGIGLTTILAELAMDEFDQAVQSIPGVYRYFRYSDDILIFCTGNLGEVEARIAHLLPNPMTFNAKKCSSTSFYGDPNPKAAAGFDYLGYRFSAPKNDPKRGKPRPCDVSISDSKIKKIKTRIVLSLKSHKSDYTLLLYRMRYLSGNYRVTRVPGYYELARNFTRSGIYYNYKRCGHYAGPKHTISPRRELMAVDWFYQHLLNSPSSAYCTVAAAAPPQIANRLRRISFHKGHTLKLQAKLPSGSAGLVKAAWRNH